MTDRIKTTVISRLMKTALLSVALLTGIHADAEVHVANNRNGVPGLKITLNDARIRRSGDEVVFYTVFQSTGTKPIGNVVPEISVWIEDGGDQLNTTLQENYFVVPADGEPLSRYVMMNGVSVNANSLSKIKVGGRAPDSAKCGPGNYYGEYDYFFNNIPLPSFHIVASDPDKKTPNGAFTDNEVKLGITSMTREGGDLIVEFTLTNVGKKDKTINSNQGYASTAEGDRLPTTVRFPESLPAGETAKGTLVVKGGANENIQRIRHDFSLIENKFYWHPKLELW